MPERGRWTFGEAGETRRALVVNPPFDRLRGLLDTSFPLWAGYVAETLEADGTETKLFNAEMPERGERLEPTSELARMERYDDYLKALRNREHRAWVQFDHLLRESKPGIVVLWVDTARYGAALAASMLVRSALGRTKIIWCGPMPSAMPAVVLNPNIDYAVRGEAERSVLELVRTLRRNQPTDTVKGIAYASDGQVVTNHSRDLVRDADTVVPPGRHLDLNRDDYPPDEIALICSARGAPVICRYSTDHIVWGRGHRRRSGYSITNELKHVAKRYKAEAFRFQDPVFTVNSRRTIDLCKALAKQKVVMPWLCRTRLDQVDEKQLDIMARTGCKLIRFEIGSGSEDVRKRLGIAASADDIGRVTQMCRSHGIAFGADIVMGFPWETEADLTATRDLVMDLDAQLIDVRVLTPEPGTAVFSDAMKMGLIPKPTDWSVFSQFNRKLNFVKDVPRKRFDELATETLEYTEHHSRSWLRSWKTGFRNPLRRAADKLFGFRKP